MKIIILKESLNNGLNIISRVAGKNLTLPILNNILIETEKSFLNLSSTDLELGIKYWSLAKIEKEQSREAALKEAYEITLARPADIAGLKYWNDSKLTPMEVIHKFMEDKEWKEVLPDLPGEWKK